MKEGAEQDVGIKRAAKVPLRKYCPIIPYPQRLMEVEIQRNLGANITKIEDEVIADKESLKPN